ncbi:2Fe-2S iron-sulfur cluster binding domain-containing protein, partial [Pseudanabaenaceae cyanobacterium LEGE 13415]|nr:2Fe-2S iron-sulfur cluster binding domain-containing protein [Pseudanabaenaceae cyanobacterium LEGE 13415]
MPKITAQGKTIECESGANLRQVLLKNGIDLYNSGSTVINCRGIGTCGTCAVEIEGDI